MLRGGGRSCDLRFVSREYAWCGTMRGKGIFVFGYFCGHALLAISAYFLTALDWSQQEFLSYIYILRCTRMVSWLRLAYD